MKEDEDDVEGVEVLFPVTGVNVMEWASCANARTKIVTLGIQLDRMDKW